MALEVFANRPTTTVSSGGTGAPAAGTQETWTVVSSSSFPAASSSAAPPSQFRVADPVAPSEVIAVTNVSGTTWTVTRGADSTTPVTHSAGFTVYQVVSAGSLRQFSQPTVMVPPPAGATATDTPNVTAAITALTAALANGPATLQFQDGTYQVDSNSAVIQSVSNFTVKGTGGTVITQAPNRSGLVNNTSGDLFVIADCSDFRVDGITFDGLRDTIAPITPLSASASSSQPSVTVASGNGARYLAGQKLFLFGGLGTGEQNQSEGFATAGAVTPLVISSITTGGGSGGGDLITFTTNLTHSYAQISSTLVSDGFGPYACDGAYLTPYQTGSATVAGRALAGEDQQNGLHLISCTRFTVTRVTARNLWESPIRLGTGYEATSLTDGCTQGTVSNCTGYHAYDQGVAAWVCTNITISGCVLNATGWAGVSLTGSDYCTVEGCQVISPVYAVPGDTGSGSGIVTEGGIRNQIAGNIISSPAQYGIETIHSPLTWGLNNASLPTLGAFLEAGTAAGTSIQVSATAAMTSGGLYSILDGPYTEAITIASIVDSTHITVSQTIQFSHASATPIGARVAQENVVEGNTIRRAANQSIMVVPSARGVLKNNNVTGGGSVGLAIDYTVGFRPATSYPAGDGTHAEGNVIGNGAGAAIKANGVTRLLIRGNQIYEPGSFGGGIELHGTTDSVISENRITDVRGSFGIVVENGGPSSTACARLVITGNVIERTSAQPGLSVQTGDSLTISGNSVHSCGGTAGIYLQGLTNSDVTGNTANSNQGAGIELTDNSAVHSQYNRISGNTCRDDGTGYNLATGGTWTQQHGIVEAGSSNSNLFTLNECDSNAVDQLTIVGAASYAWANTLSNSLSGTFPASQLPAATTSVQGAVIIDSTASHLAAPGAQAAGSVGKPPDSGHVHPNAPQGGYARLGSVAGWTMPEAYCGSTLQPAGGQAGILMLFAVEIPAPAVVSNFSMFVTAAGNNPANVYACLVDTSGNIQASTANRSGDTALTTSNNLWTAPFQSGYTAPAGQYYAGLLIGSATTMPTFLSGTNRLSSATNFGVSAGAVNLRSANYSSGLSTVPSSPITLSSAGGYVGTPWVALT